MEIPVQNVFYLLTYAWREYRAGQTVEVSEIDAETPLELLAHLLVESTRRLLRRGLDRGYQTALREVAGVRGQIDFNASLGRMLLPEGRTACRVDELSHDVLHNRLLKATLEQLSRLEQLDGGLRADTGRLARKLDDVGEIELRPRYFDRVQLDSNARFYRFVLSICRMVAEGVFVDEETGQSRFRDLLEDEARMHAIFEKFVRHFYQREADGLEVSAEQIAWDAVPADDESRALLPGMKTDITLRGPERVLIIDTKYYKKTLKGRFGRSVPSENLYQIFAYLENFAATKSVERPVEGMLLYPTVGESLDLEYELRGYRVRVCTVDLGTDWRKIDRRLRQLHRS